MMRPLNINPEETLLSISFDSLLNSQSMSTPNHIWHIFCSYVFPPTLMRLNTLNAILNLVFQSHNHIVATCIASVAKDAATREVVCHSLYASIILL